MREDDGAGDSWHPPPPSVSTAALMLVFLTAMTLFNMVALLLHAGRTVLKVVLVALMFAPLVIGTGLATRARRRGRADSMVLGATVLASILVQNAARPLLDLSEGQPLNVFDKALLVLIPLFLLGLLLFWVGTRRGRQS